MKSFLKTLVICATLAVASISPVNAQSQTDALSVEDLSKESQIKINQEILRLKQQESAKALGVTQLDEYAEFGKKYGAAIAESAKALGQTVNDFLNTPAGKLAIIFIAWKVFGQELYGFVTSMIWFTIMLPLYVFAVKKFVYDARQKWMESMNPELNFDKSSIENLGANYVIWSIVMVIAFLFVCITGFTLM